MDQLKTGAYIARKREERNLTRAELAQRLNTTEKAIEKWELGKCFPNYALIRPLCWELGISVGELVDGVDDALGTASIDEEQLLLAQIKRMQYFGSLRNSMLGLTFIALGAALACLSFSINVSHAQVLLTGLALVCGIGMIALGISLAIKGHNQRK